MNKEEFIEKSNNFSLIGILNTFEELVSKKNTAWGRGTIKVGTGKYTRHFGFITFDEDIVKTLVENQSNQIHITGKLSLGQGEYRYQISLIANTCEVLSQYEEETVETGVLPF